MSEANEEWVYLGDVFEYVAELAENRRGEKALYVFRTQRDLGVYQVIRVIDLTKKHGSTQRDALYPNSTKESHLVLNYFYDPNIEEYPSVRENKHIHQLSRSGAIGFSVLQDKMKAVGRSEVHSLKELEATLHIRSPGKTYLIKGPQFMQDVARLVNRPTRFIVTMTEQTVSKIKVTAFNAQEARAQVEKELKTGDCTILSTEDRKPTFTVERDIMLDD